MYIKFVKNTKTKCFLGTRIGTHFHFFMVSGLDLTMIVIRIAHNGNSLTIKIQKAVGVQQ